MTKDTCYESALMTERNCSICGEVTERCWTGGCACHVGLRPVCYRCYELIKITPIPWDIDIITFIRGKLGLPLVNK